MVDSYYRSGVGGGCHCQAGIAYDHNDHDIASQISHFDGTADAA